MKKMHWAWIGAAGLGLGCLAGCGRAPEAYFPLEDDATWSFSFRSGFVSRVEELRVARRSSVAGEHGWELDSSMGPSRLAWSGGRLVAESVPGARFSPALTLLAPSTPEHEWSWPESGQGYVTLGGRSMAGKAEVTQVREDLKVGGRTFETLRTTIALRASGRLLELDTWFAPGIGPIRQEQRNDGDLVALLERIGGP